VSALRIQADVEEIVSSGCGIDSMAGSTVLITGATGLIGGYLLETLATAHRYTGGEPIEIIALTRSPEVARRQFASVDSKQLTIINHALDGPIELDRRVDFVVHGASPATPSDFAKDPVGVYVPNVVGTHFLLQLAAAHEVSGFLFLSSGAVQGAPQVTGDCLDESMYGPIDHLDAASGYAEAKRMGEAACGAWFRSATVPVTIARLGHTYGPGLRRSDSRAMAEFVYAAIDGRDIVIHSDGLTRRDYCYLSDATRALLLLLTDGQRGEPYFVVNTEASLTVRQLADLLAELAPAPGIEVQMRGGARPASYLPHVQPYYRPDIGKIELMGWSPQVGAREGFSRTLEACRDTA
jgi:UDP-glucuronate decarboxylase